jgi:pyruvate formate lyase activating enzyme
VWRWIAAPSPATEEARRDLTPARFYEQQGNNHVRCLLCFHKCTIPPGRVGICRVRKNHQGRLYTLVYGRPAGLQTDPIEAEPMYHMMPGHRNLGVYTASCNFRCQQCHNWHITQRGPEEVQALTLSPEEVVAEALRRGSRSISYTINEPTVFFEFMYDVSIIARNSGLLNLFHTNGSMDPEPLRAVLRHMDGVVVDLKAFCDNTYRRIYSGELAPVLGTLQIIREAGVHLEIVNLVIPTINDRMDEIRAMSEWIVKRLGPDVPLHFSRFHPAYRLTHLPPTPVKTLEEAIRIARVAGLKFVTIGNVPGHHYNSTYCPRCQEMLVHRVGFAVLANSIKDGKCSSCGERIPGIWTKEGGDGSWILQSSRRLLSS